ncbi:VHS1012 protein [Vibrio phage 1]|nr:VHS1012 protein [Vibrio phage 1]
MYSNKKAKALIERLTPEPSTPWEVKDLPWLNHDFMNPLSTKEQQKQNRLLMKLEKLLGREHFEELIGYLRESGNTWNYQITHAAFGGYQDEGGRHVRDVWISQSCGIAGDDWSGEVYVRVTKQRFFYFEFAC